MSTTAFIDPDINFSKYPVQLQNELNNEASLNTIYFSKNDANTNIIIMNDNEELYCTFTDNGRMLEYGPYESMKKLWQEVWDKVPLYFRAELIEKCRLKSMLSSKILYENHKKAKTKTPADTSEKSSDMGLSSPSKGIASDDVAGTSEQLSSASANKGVSSSSIGSAPKRSDYDEMQDQLRKLNALVAEYELILDGKQDGINQLSREAKRFLTNSTDLKQHKDKLSDLEETNATLNRVVEGLKKNLEDAETANKELQQSLSQYKKMTDELQSKNDTLHEELARIKDQNAKVLDINTMRSTDKPDKEQSSKYTEEDFQTLLNEKETLVEEKYKLNTELKRLKSIIPQSANSEEVLKYHTENTHLKKEITRLQENITKLQENITKLQKELREYNHITRQMDTTPDNNTEDIFHTPFTSQASNHILATPSFSRYLNTITRSASKDGTGSEDSHEINEDIVFLEYNFHRVLSRKINVFKLIGDKTTYTDIQSIFGDVLRYLKETIQTKNNTPEYEDYAELETKIDEFYSKYTEPILTYNTSSSSDQNSSGKELAKMLIQNCLNDIVDIENCVTSIDTIEIVQITDILDRFKMLRLIVENCAYHAHNEMQAGSLFVFTTTLSNYTMTAHKITDAMTTNFNDFVKGKINNLINMQNLLNAANVDTIETIRDYLQDMLISTTDALKNTFEDIQYVKNGINVEMLKLSKSIEQYSCENGTLELLPTLTIAVQLCNIIESQSFKVSLFVHAFAAPYINYIINFIHTVCKEDVKIDEFAKYIKTEIYNKICVDVFAGNDVSVEKIKRMWEEIYNKIDTSKLGLVHKDRAVTLENNRLHHEKYVVDKIYHRTFSLICAHESPDSIDTFLNFCAVDTVSPKPDYQSFLYAILLHITRINVAQSTGKDMIVEVNGQIGTNLEEPEFTTWLFIEYLRNLFDSLCNISELYDELQYICIFMLTLSGNIQIKETLTTQILKDMKENVGEIMNWGRGKLPNSFTKVLENINNILTCNNKEPLTIVNSAAYYIYTHIISEYSPPDKSSSDKLDHADYFKKLTSEEFGIVMLHNKEYLLKKLNDVDVNVRVGADNIIVSNMLGGDVAVTLTKKDDDVAASLSRIIGDDVTGDQNTEYKTILDLICNLHKEADDQIETTFISIIQYIKLSKSKKPQNPHKVKYFQNMDPTLIAELQNYGTTLSPESYMETKVYNILEEFMKEYFASIGSNKFKYSDAKFLIDMCTKTIDLILSSVLPINVVLVQNIMERYTSLHSKIEQVTDQENKNRLLKLLRYSATCFVYYVERIYTFTLISVPKQFIPTLEKLFKAENPEFTRGRFIINKLSDQNLSLITKKIKGPFDPEIPRYEEKRNRLVEYIYDWARRINDDSVFVFEEIEPKILEYYNLTEISKHLHNSLTNIKSRNVVVSIQEIDTPSGKAPRNQSVSSRKPTPGPTSKARNSNTLNPRPSTAKNTTKKSESRRGDGSNPPEEINLEGRSGSVRDPKSVINPETFRAADKEDAASAAAASAQKPTTRNTSGGNKLRQHKSKAQDI